MSTRLYLVRHGATQLSAEDRFAGAVDVELSDEGRHQATKLGERLMDLGIDAVYASPMSRTMETASIIAKRHHLAPIGQDGLREIGHGHWEGMTRAEVELAFPVEYATWEADPFTFAPQSGESGISVLARALPVIRQIVVDHEDKNVLVVSHKATIRILISSLLGFDTRGYRDRLDQAPACLNILDFKDTIRARLTLFNDISHYTARISRVGGRLSKWWDPSAKE